MGLRAVDDNALDRDPRLGRLRREFKASEIFALGLWAEEHMPSSTPRRIVGSRTSSARACGTF